ncbi:MAG: dpaA [Bacillales bacterium]|nr:dpaA [Bacillales bacterium]
MLTGLQVAVIGGDARQLEVIKKLSELDARIILIGFDQLGSSFPGTFKEDFDDFDPKNLDAIILPVSGASEDGKIQSIFTSKDLYLNENFISKTMPNSVIYSGIGTNFLVQIADKTKRKLINLLDRDDVAIYNSIPTVEGVLLLTIQNTDFTIHGSNVIILGLGRCGLSLARVFHAIGAKVKVGVRKTEYMARITEMGIEPFHLDQLKQEVSNVDICINTIPHQIITSEVIAQMPHHTTIIDIASKPGGTDFKFAERRGINALLAPGLPGIVAPKTAGKILANVLTQLLSKQLQTKNTQEKRDWNK